MERGIFGFRGRGGGGVLSELLSQCVQGESNMMQYYSLGQKKKKLELYVFL